MGSERIRLNCPALPITRAAVNYRGPTIHLLLRTLPMKINQLDPHTQEALEAAAFRRLLAHLDSRKDVQNIALMNLAGFCRNCLSKWYVAAAEEKGIALDYEDARERVYGMPYGEWKERYQTPASEDELARFNGRGE